MTYDMVESLPLELLIYLAEFLDLEDIVRSQRVCKRWRAIFSCSAIITALLRETLEFLGLNQEGVSIDAAISDATSYFRWRRCLEHVQPVKKTFLPWPNDGLHTLSCKLGQIRYQSRRLCCNITTHYQIFKMLNLETGEKSNPATTVPMARKIEHITLSDRYLVMTWPATTFFDYLGAWDLRSNQIVTQQFPIVSLDHGLLCRPYMVVGDKVIITDCTYWGPSPVYVWDLSSNHVQQIGTGNFSNLRMCHVNADESVLVAFEIYMKNPPPEILVRQTKWSTTTGQLIEKKIIKLPLPPGPVVNRCIFQPYRTYGQKTVTQFFFDNGTHNNKPAAMHLEYDYTVDRLNVRWIREPIFDTVFYDLSACLTPNLVYRFSTMSGQIAAYNATTGTVTRRSVLCGKNRAIGARPILGSILELQREFWSNKPQAVFGDREVFGWTNANGIQLWIFNPNFALDIIPDLR